MTMLGFVTNNKMVDEETKIGRLLDKPLTKRPKNQKREGMLWNWAWVSGHQLRKAVNCILLPRLE